MERASTGPGPARSGPAGGPAVPAPVTVGRATGGPGLPYADPYSWAHESLMSSWVSRSWRWTCGANRCTAMAGGKRGSPDSDSEGALDRALPAALVTPVDPVIPVLLVPPLPPAPVLPPADATATEAEASEAATDDETFEMPTDGS